MDDCLFCKIIAGEIPSWKIYENDEIYAFLDITPNNKGHTLVVPKIHHENIYEMSDEVVSSIFKVVKKLSPVIKKAVGSDGINIVMNNEAAAGQVIFHAHVHIIPRHNDDGFKHWAGKEYAEGEADETAKKIKNAL